MVGAAAGLLPFCGVLGNMRLDPFRTPRVERFGSNFYDIQARALFHGHLAVPDRILGIESFNIDGRTYMYFPPFPAILRMPVLLVTDRFDARLTAPSMLLAWMLIAAAAVLLVWRARYLVRGDAAVSRTDAVASGLLIAAVTGGTPLLYIASLPWVYHEVYLWSAAWTVGALACFARLAVPGVVPRRRDLGLLGGCVLGAILTRATAGWPVAIATVAFGAWFALRRVDRRRQTGVLLVVAGVVPLIVSAVINWMKFRHPYMIPLEYQQWSEVSARRRMALLANDGSLAGTQFFRTTLANYFRPNGIRFVPYFPFVTFPAEPARSYGGAFLDQTYRTGSVPTFMPLLFLLGIGGFVATFRRGAGRALAAMRIPLLGALGATATVMCYGYIGFRYTSEFVAVLTGASAIGLAELTRRLARRSPRTKYGVLVGIGVLAAFGILANSAVGLATERTTGRGDALVRFVSWQDRISSLTGNFVADITHVVGVLPPSAPPDDLYIVGDCDALYLSTGDLYEPWVTVEERTRIVRIQASSDGVRPAVLQLIAIDGRRAQQISVQTNSRNEIRVRVGEGIYVVPTDWQPLPPNGRVELTLVADTARDTFDVTLGDVSFNLPLAQWSADWNMVLTRAAFALSPVADQLRSGLGLTAEMGPPLELCNRLLDRADA